MGPPDRPDPYATLGLTPSASDEELRHAYRRLVMTHHPDHNGGSPESAVRFAEVQEAYAHVRLQRRTAARPATGTGDPAMEARIAAMEQELAAARALRERAARRAERIARLRRPARPAPRPTDEELGYVSTQDSFSKILDDALDERRRAPERPASQPQPQPQPPPAKPRSVADWIDELSSRLTGEDR